MTEDGTWSLVAMAKREGSRAAEQPLVHKGKQSRSPGGLTFSATLKLKRNFHIGLQVRNMILLF